MKHGKYFFSLSLCAFFTIVSLTANPCEAAKRRVSHHHKKQTASEGAASFYSRGFHGRKTANGETFNTNQLTAAHPSLPFGTWVKVTNLSNGKEVVVRINDRGPFIKGRVIDLSKSAAKKIGITQSGVVQVKLEAVPTSTTDKVSG